MAEKEMDMERQHLITDWDGVLADTLHTNFAIINRLHPAVTFNDYRINHHMGNVYANPVVPFTSETAEAYFAAYNNQLSLAHITAALPTVRRIGGRYQWHIVTSNCEWAVRRVLDEADVDDYFGSMLGREAHTSKQEKFTRLLCKEGVQANRTLYITDTVGDLKEAHSVGLRTIAVTFGYHPADLLAQYSPTALARSWNELETAIHRLMPQ